MEQQLPEGQQVQSTTQLVRAAMRFFWVIKRRRSLLIASLVVACVLGGLYYLTATREYRAVAEVLVMKTDSNEHSAVTQEGPSKGLISTYKQLFTSAVVLEGAIERLPEPPPEIARNLPRELWSERLRKNLSADHARDANIISIGYRSENAEASVQVVNAVVESYLEFMDKNQRNVALELVASLDKERTKLESTIMQKEQELQEARRKHGDLGLSESSTNSHPMLQRALKLNEELMRVQQKRVELEAVRSSLKNSANSGSDITPQLAALEPYLGRDFLMQLLGQDSRLSYTISTLERVQIDDRAKLAALSQHYGPAHPEVVQLQQKIQASSQFIADSRQQQNQVLEGIRDPQIARRLVAIVEETIANLWQHEATLEQEYKVSEAEALAFNDRLAEVAMAEHDLELLRNLHDVLLNRIANIDINTDHNNLQVAVVSEPVVPRKPVSPQLAYAALVSILLGSAVGVGVIYILDILDDAFRSPEEVQDQLGMPVLAMTRPLQQREGVGAETLQVHAAPNAVESEAFRTLRTTLAFSGEETRRISATSAEPGDGKTTVLANLAVAFAQAGKKTLLIDCDLRRPGMTNLFGVRGLGGVSEVLRSDEEISGMVRERLSQTGIANLDLLPAGPRPVDPAELLSRHRLADLIAWAEAEYDQVLIDCPPVLVSSDAALVGRLVDGAILVVRPEKNHRRRVVHAVESFRMLSVRLIGSVVNGVGDGSSGYYDYGSSYGYGYGYGHADEGHYGDDFGPPEESAATNDDIAVPLADSSASDSPAQPRRRVA